MSPEPETDSFRDIDRLRATLRLCFDEDRADRVAALAQNESVDPVSLVPVIRAARLIFEISRWRGLWRRRQARPILSPRIGLPATAALTLAFHLGLGMTSGELGLLTGRTPERIGDDLIKARRLVGPAMAAPCPEFASLIGRERDPVVDRDEALSLMLHLGQCDRCREALSRSRGVDEMILSEIHAARPSLPFLIDRRNRFDSLLTHPIPLWLAGLFALALVVGGFSGARALHGAPKTELPLAVSTTTPESSGGWLLKTSDSGEVDAVNVSTGGRRRLIPAPESGVAQDLISPDQRTIAQWTTSAERERPDKLRIFNLDGSIAHEWSLANPQRILIPLAWLNNSTMIVSRIPTSAFSSSFELFTEQTDQQGSAILFNVDTGDEQTIFSRGVRSAVPSPDGRFIVIGRYAMRLAQSVELRPFDGKTLGPDIATLDEGGLPIYWSPDSQRVFFTRSRPLQATPVPRNLGDRGLSGQPAFSYSIASLGSDGRIETVMDLPLGDIGNVVGISPDGTHLIYVSGSSTAEENDWTFWQSSIDGKNPVRIASAIPGVRRESAIWSPSGDAFLTTSEPFYLSQAPSIPASVGPSSFVTLMLDERGRPLKALGDQFVDPTLLGYESELPILPTNDSAATNRPFAAARPISGLGAHLNLTAGSQLDQGGDHLLLYDRATNLTVAVSLSGGLGAVPLGNGRDAAWLPDGNGIISVNQYTLQQSSRSRIAIDEPASVLISGPAEFDPANLGDASQSSYRFPRLSPDGLYCSFFVVRDRQISLWIAGREEPARAVATWDLPADARIDAPLVSEWIGNDTLVVAFAEEWTDGFPLRVTLERIQISGDGQAQVQPLVSWHVHGAEQGISIAEIATSPDGSKVAARLRHFTGGNSTRDRFDSIDVGPTANLGDSLELARGKPGDGLSWAPDGTELAAALDGQIVVTSATGSRIARPPVGSSPARFPVWVRPNEIWFSSGSDNRATILRLVR